MRSIAAPWLSIGIATVTLGLLPELQGCSSVDVSREHDASRPSARRISPGCDRVEESLRYDDFIGARALAILSWTGMSEEASNLEIPVYVVGTEGGAIVVRFLQFPMREQYLHVWLSSGHIAATEEDVFLLDPCSATLEPWPEPKA